MNILNSQWLVKKCDRPCQISVKYFLACFLFSLFIPTSSTDSLHEKLLNEFRSFFGGKVEPPPKPETNAASPSNAAEKSIIPSNTQFAIVYTQVLHIFHPLMLKFDYQRNAFIKGEVQYYALPNFYDGLLSKLKGKRLSAENEESHQVGLKLAKVELEKTDSVNEQILETVATDIIEAIETIRREKNYLLVIHENISTASFPQQRRLLSHGINNLTMEVLRYIHKKHHQTEQKTSKLLENLELILNQI